MCVSFKLEIGSYAIEIAENTETWKHALIDFIPYIKIIYNMYSIILFDNLSYHI